MCVCVGENENIFFFEVQINLDFTKCFNLDTECQVHDYNIQ